MLQHDKRKVRISGKTAPPIPGGKYSSGWQPPHRGHSYHREPRESFQSPEVHPQLGPHAAKSYGPDQVILFMEDGKGSGVPVLGRRVPIGYNMLESPEVELVKEQPVLGRRSHRLNHNHHQQQAHLHRLMIKSHQHHKSKCAMIMNDELTREQYWAPEPSQQALSGLQIGLLRKGRLHQSRSSANIPAEAYLESGQLNWPLPVQQSLGANMGHPVRKHASRLQIPCSPSHGPGAGAELLQPAPMNLMASPPCSSLCSADECHSCYSPPSHKQQVAACREGCCVSSYALPECRKDCCQPLPKPKSTLAANKPTRAIRHPITTQAPDSTEYVYLAREAPSQRQGRTRVAHQGGVALRARSSHEICQQRRSQQEQQPMRISGRNMLPVKRRVPVLVDGEDKSQVSGSVSQIYESLAAELKAKLGDPRLAPILLPPKDYDTLNRRYGKLEDTETRRSTNPHLVGPVTAMQKPKINPTSGKQHSYSDDQNRASEEGRQLSNDMASSGKQDKLLMTDSANECDSARSSGRQSHLDRSLVCRSRSNSSSGLGSISMGAGSGNSSPSSKCSSRDDMHRIVQSGVNSARLPAIKSATTNGSGSRACVGSKSGRSCDDKARDTHHRESGHTDMPGESLLRVDTDYRERPLGEFADKTSAKSHPQSTGANGNQHLTSTPADLDVSKGRLVGNGYGGTLRWKGRVEIPLKVNSEKNGNTYLATKQIIY